MKKTSTQARKSTLYIYPPDQTGAAALNNSAAAGTGTGQALAELVWRHFREEITQALHEAKSPWTRESAFIIS
jgi:hypothetical protein